ncbi:C45 family peptidase [Vogesella sp. LIG4]|uniref:C45 family autoproteolytic acyltransferase/hydolase n=1 Tax=Vogesella sp. LIG4 TaxID=1192162 RepID=UPI0008201279|nr:C45 family peptidase [Vogesella sp. LIG4]SCK25604.1 isopenicillin-N N-acyltransferase like protein [Vogesella sp. LIG4]
MNVHTFSTDTPDAFFRGHQIGSRWQQQIQRSVALYLGFFPRLGIASEQVRAIGDASLSALEDWAPELAEEIKGVAAGAQLPLWQLACLNARTEVLAAAPASKEGECSTTVHAPAGSRAPRTLQTWDWHDSLVPDGLIMRLSTHQGMTVKLFTEFGMLGKIGVNSAGLGLHFNILHHASDNAHGGVPVHAVARRVLEEARSVAEAIELARSARVSASTVLTVFSCQDEAPARAASIELSPARTGLVYPDAAGWILHTNHFIETEQSLGERTPDVSTTYARYQHLQAVQGDMVADDIRTRAAAMCGPAGADAPICFHPDMSMPDTERWETLLTIGIDTEQCRLLYAAGNPTTLAANGYQQF